MHAALPGWGEFYKQLSNVHAFVCRKERVYRFKWTCVRNSPFEQVAAYFKHISGKLYDKRWHVVVPCLRKAMPAYLLMASAWDPVILARGVDTMGMNFREGGLAQIDFGR